MQTETQIRNRLVKKILEIPAKKLKPLSAFVSQLETEPNENQSNVLACSGAWRDNDTFKDLTGNLNQNRQSQRNIPRIKNLTLTLRRLLNLFGIWVFVDT